MKKIVYLVALVAISLLFVQCEEQPCTCTPCPCVDNACTCGGNCDNNDNTDNTGNNGSSDFNTGDNGTKEEGIGVEAGHAYVDLGLPSGLKWATCNVGATVSTDFGDYFAWGEVEPKTTYNWSTYKYCVDKYDNLTKYCSQSSYGNNGFTDSKTVLDPEDDAAVVNWGGKWRMPTTVEQQELVDNCTFLYTSKTDANGYAVFGGEVTGPNGNSIFLPAAGYMNGGYLGGVGSYGYCWSSSLVADDPFFAYYLILYSDDWYVGNIRYYGFSVRPVCP